MATDSKYFNISYFCELSHTLRDKSKNNLKEIVQTAYLFLVHFFTFLALATSRKLVTKPEGKEKLIQI